MATIQLSPHPSFRELEQEPGRAVYFSDAAKCLYWPLAGSFPIAISVMKSRRGALEERESLLQPDRTWHEITSQPLTEPKVSSIDASIFDFHQWEPDWVAMHEDHDAAEYVTYGDLNDEDRPYAREPKEDGSWEEDSDTEFLLRCCGQDRPMRKRGLKPTVTPSSGNDFVSIYDYVTRHKHGLHE